MDATRELIDQIRERAADQAYFSASRVQGWMFDLYGVVEADAARRLVETWLTLTIQRELFSGAEMAEVLDELEGLVAQPVSR